MPNSDQMHTRRGKDPKGRDPRDTPPWLWIVVLAILAIAIVFSVHAAKAHDIDERYDPGPDSMKVQLEIDATGDGLWEVRHVFFDTLGVWDRSSAGFMRVTYTQWTWSEAGDSTRVTQTDYGHFWRDMFNADLDLIEMVGLNELAQFGYSYGRPMTVTPDGTKMWEAWITYEDRPDSTLAGYFYFYPGERSQ